jgi:hypothetical protein
MKNALLVSAALLGAALHGQPVNYVEGVSGDLSNDANGPTFLNFDVGQNLVSGRMGRPGTGPIDRDIFSFTLGQGERVTSIDILSFAPTSNAGVGAFLALSMGNMISTANTSNHLSNTLVSGTGGILDDLKTSAFSNSVGASVGLRLEGELDAGTYTVWFQELATFVDYQIGFTVTPVPEPSTYAACGAAALGLLALRRRMQARRSAA